MPVLCEFINIFVKFSSLAKISPPFAIKGQADSEMPGIYWHDGEIVRFGAMNDFDAQEIVNKLKGLGLKAGSDYGGYSMPWVELCGESNLGMVKLKNGKSTDVIGPHNFNDFLARTFPSISVAGNANYKHNERCKKCKARFEQALKYYYPGAQANHSLDIPCQIADIRKVVRKPEALEILDSIYESLTKSLELRQINLNFVKVKKLPRVDYFLPEEKIIIEFDESQHFTEARRISLQHYGKTLQFGFDVANWSKLCSVLNKKDNNPPYRDEQRAWYDTLRDFAPYIGTQAQGNTLRVFSMEQIWCEMDNYKIYTHIKHLIEHFK